MYMVVTAITMPNSVPRELFVKYMLEEHLFHVLRLHVVMFSNFSHVFQTPAV